jgi:prepilin signal peptidase PulO-like enzyme (type II secretory pathway)
MVVLKIFRSVWFLSLLAVTAALLYGYASMREEVIVREAVDGAIRISRETFFYMVLALLTIINVLVFIIARIMVRSEDFKSWFYGLVITFNIFFIVGIGFVSLYNSGETYDYSRLQPVMYGSIGLLLLWSFAWPIYVSYKRLAGKS